MHSHSAAVSNLTAPRIPVA